MIETIRRFMDSEYDVACALWDFAEFKLRREGGDIDMRNFLKLVMVTAKDDELAAAGTTPEHILKALSRREATWGDLTGTVTVGVAKAPRGSRLDVVWVNAIGGKEVYKDYSWPQGLYMKVDFEHLMFGRRPAIRLTRPDGSMAFPSLRLLGCK